MNGNTHPFDNLWNKVFEDDVFLDIIPYGPNVPR